MTFFSRKHLRLLLLPALLLLTGCAGSAKETADSTENEKLSAVATIFPQYDFLRAIGGDHLDLHMLLSPGAESHSFEPTPGDMITVSVGIHDTLIPQEAWDSACTGSQI